MIIDVITYNGEWELFDLRYSILKPYVDCFIVIEFDRTFSGKEKPFYFEDIAHNYEKVDYHKIAESQYSKYKELAKSNPSTEYGKGAQHWITEFCQKESIKDALINLEDDDMVFIGDCDEIWNPDLFRSLTIYPAKIKLKVYTYFLNNRSDEKFWGTIVALYKDIKGKCLNDLRNTFQKTEYDLGWHFTSMGGHEAVKRKLIDSYTEESYAKLEVLNNLEKNINENKDFLFRSFTYMNDSSEWPQYLKENWRKYKKLISPAFFTC